MKYTIKELLEKVLEVNTVYKKFYDKFTKEDIKFVIDTPEYNTYNFYILLNDHFADEELVDYVIKHDSSNIDSLMTYNNKLTKNSIKKIIDKGIYLDILYRRCNKQFDEELIKYAINRGKDLDDLFMYNTLKFTKENKLGEYLKRKLDRKNGIESKRVESGKGYLIRPDGSYFDINIDTHMKWIFENKNDNDIEQYFDNNSELYNEDEYPGMTDELVDINDRMLDDGWVIVRKIGKTWRVVYNNSNSRKNINDFLLENMKDNEQAEVNENDGTILQKNVEQIKEDGLFGSKK